MNPFHRGQDQQVTSPQHDAQELGYQGTGPGVTVDLEIPLQAGVYTYDISPTAGYVYSVTASGGSGYTVGEHWTAAGGNGTGTMLWAPTLFLAV